MRIEVLVIFIFLGKFAKIFFKFYKIMKFCNLTMINLEKFVEKISTIGGSDPTPHCRYNILTDISILSILVIFSEVPPNKFKES